MDFNWIGLAGWGPDNKWYDFFTIIIHYTVIVITECTSSLLLIIIIEVSPNKLKKKYMISWCPGVNP